MTNQMTTNRHRPNRHRSSRNRLARTLVALVAAGFVMMAASSAFALDNYADRKGLFFGLGIGGGVGGVDLANDQGEAGFEDGRLPGFHANAMLGGGVNENIVLGAQYNWWGRTVTKGENQWAHHHTSFLAAGNFFLIKGLYLEGGGGLAYSTFDGTRGGEDKSHNEMGFALKGGAGYEFFINGTHAIGVNGGYTRHFYDTASFDTFNAGISVRWY
jgi:hypothetical protein